MEKTNKNETDKRFKIGSIVSLNSHPYREDITDIIFGGEPLFTPPLMVVTEILYNTRYSHDEYTGTELANKSTHQYKCIWYSTKNHKFEEEWLSGKLLLLIQDVSDDEKPITFTGDNRCLSLKTLIYESQKLKSSLNGDNTGFERKLKITALLSFTPPIMQYVGSIKNESKEPIFDPKTHQRKREISSLLIKCKYFNPSSDKISEISLPIEALVQIQPIENKKLQTIGNYIAGGILIQQNIKADESRPHNALSVLLPRRIVSKFGMFFLEANDKTQNKPETIQIDNNLDQFSVLPKPKCLSMFNEINGRMTRNIFDEGTVRSFLNIPSEETIANYQQQNRILFRIKYTNGKTQTTDRFVSDCKFLKLDPKVAGYDSQDSRDLPEPWHLRAYCHYRNDVRFFRIDRIEKFEAFFLNVMALSADGGNAAIEFER